MNDRSTDWCLDSGCLAHRCKNEKDFLSIDKIKPRKLNLASNASTEIKIKGFVTITADCEGKTKYVNLWF